jgi:hypothetical protein
MWRSRNAALGTGGVKKKKKRETRQFEGTG